MNAHRVSGTHSLGPRLYRARRTFLPAAARALVPNPAVFGWAWPVFGVAAAVSTLAAAPLLRRYGPLRVWTLAQTVMAVGVLAPVVRPGLPGVVVAAVTVGGTFMVVTFAAMQAARELAPQQTASSPP